jgi:two-component system alkaline phosphatase synthesis response regulator PhoP
MNTQTAMNRTTERILVAEDETSLRNELLEFLRMEGFDVICAADGREAFLAAKEHRPDLVISDLLMPEWDGARLLLEMQSDPELRNTPIIFLTAMVDRKNVRDGMALGAADYLTKPFSLKELFSTIHAQLDKRARINSEIQDASRQTREDASRSIGDGLREPVRSIRSEAEKLLSSASVADPLRIREHAEKIVSEAGALELRLQNLPAPTRQ